MRVCSHIPYAINVHLLHSTILVLRDTETVSPCFPRTECGSVTRPVRREFVKVAKYLITGRVCRDRPGAISYLTDVYARMLCSMLDN